MVGPPMMGMPPPPGMLPPPPGMFGPMGMARPPMMPPHGHPAYGMRPPMPGRPPMMPMGANPRMPHPPLAPNQQPVSAIANEQAPAPSTEEQKQLPNLNEEENKGIKLEVIAEEAEENAQIEVKSEKQDAFDTKVEAGNEEAKAQ